MSQTTSSLSISAPSSFSASSPSFIPKPKFNINQPLPYEAKQAPRNSNDAIDDEPNAPDTPTSQQDDNDIAEEMTSNFSALKHDIHAASVKCDQKEINHELFVRLERLEHSQRASISLLKEKMQKKHKDLCDDVETTLHQMFTYFEKRLNSHHSVTFAEVFPSAKKQSDEDDEIIARRRQEKEEREHQASMKEIQRLGRAERERNRQLSSDTYPAKKLQVEENLLKKSHIHHNQ